MNIVVEKCKYVNNNNFVYSCLARPELVPLKPTGTKTKTQINRALASCRETKYGRRLSSTRRTQSALLSGHLQISENFLTDWARSLKYSYRISVIICKVELDMECQPMFEHIRATDVVRPCLMNSSVIFGGGSAPKHERSQCPTARRPVKQPLCPRTATGTAHGRTPFPRTTLQPRSGRTRPYGVCRRLDDRRREGH